ncbi:hypothetical protein UFOVP558_60 [uncultured Caudovirales phage]|uniref:Uncharacterized protein n=1 Tax=uncultured Caudovirales phage TaxID=2100421 RepID=A0A6J5MTB8_9CAUD|nr:hypothetical protein UFOVP558_60 [uncultured Caudovirales phage]
MNALIIALVLFLTACGGSGGGGASTQANAPAPDQGLPSTDPGAIAPAPTTPATPTVVSLTYYSLSKTVAPVSGWPTKQYTAVGSCATFESNTYCWDDGLKSLSWSASGNNYGPYTYTYWSTMDSGTHPLHCSGGCTNSYLTTPRLIESVLEPMLTTISINQVLSTGTPTTVSCTKDNGQLDCGGWTVTL